MKRLSLLLALALPACGPQPANVGQASAAAPAAPPAVAVPVASPPPEAPAPAAVPAAVPSRPLTTPIPAAPSPAQTAPAAQPHRIGAAALKAAVDAGDAIVVDVRGDLAWQLARIDGAISIPLGDLFRRSVELPADKLIAFYCTCPAEESSGHAAEELAQIGFERTVALVGGLDAWRAAGYPIAGEGITK